MFDSYVAKFLISYGWPNSKWDSNLESRFNEGKHNSKGNFNFHMVCIRKIPIDGYGWQRILIKYCKFFFFWERIKYCKFRKKSILGIFFFLNIILGI